MMKFHINNFYLVLNAITILDILKKLHGKEYKEKNLEKVKIMISQQITRDSAIFIINNHQLEIIKDFVMKKKLLNYNINIIPIKTILVIKITCLKNYKKIDF